MGANPLALETLPVTEEQARAASVSGVPTPAGKVDIQNYDPAWPGLYARGAERLSALLGERVLALEHVGSTAVPGLAAKPIIDIDLSLENSADEAAYLPRLEDAGYRLEIREPDWHEHRVFKGPDTNINLHVWTLGSPEAQRHVLFRDHLRNHDEDRQRYGDLKRELARRDFAYMYEYNNAKASLIREIYARIFAGMAETSEASES